MIKRRLYGDSSEIEKLLANMQLMEKAEGGWAAVYKDKDTGKFWFQCHATSEAQGGAYELLISLPLPNTEELITIAISSEHDDEVMAAVLRLLDEESLENKPFRHIILAKLEEEVASTIDANKQDRFKKIINLLRLNDATNRRDVVGKTQEEVQQDAAYFQSLAARANSLLSKLN